METTIGFRSYDTKRVVKGWKEIFKMETAGFRA